LDLVERVVEVEQLQPEEIPESVVGTELLHRDPAEFAQAHSLDKRQFGV
jgi:hypothetical protein